MHRTLLAMSVAVAASSLAHAESAPAGSVTGTVLFEGEPPAQDTLPVSRDPACAQRPAQAEDVVVERGKLRDVVVRISQGASGSHRAPSAPAVIDQRACMYTPRVVGIVAGQALQVRNSDGTFHNVRGTLAGKLVWNKPQAQAAAPLALPAPARAGQVLEMACDVHPWMRAYVAVHDHPYFAVTGPDGGFRITGLAPGAYTLEAWHPTLGRQEMPIRIGRGAKAAVTARFSYKM